MSKLSKWSEADATLCTCCRTPSSRELCGETIGHFFLISWSGPPAPQSPASTQTLVDAPQWKPDVCLNALLASNLVIIKVSDIKGKVRILIFMGTFRDFQQSPAKGRDTEKEYLVLINEHSLTLTAGKEV